ncbi:hypothetical protein GH714_013359 [Hevea brasiliensis]|uniref:Uncharacterized protein n=1 Tax=Hevea brasiliensis TaxID=3981 RepID=A0A6A6K535_HEVBR|nr:hypothetical protein GH714_013359 [Hevea brasiliensis]
MDKLSMKVDSSAGGSSNSAEVGAANVNCAADFSVLNQDFSIISCRVYLIAEDIDFCDAYLALIIRELWSFRLFLDPLPLPAGKKGELKARFLPLPKYFLKFQSTMRFTISSPVGELLDKRWCSELKSLLDRGWVIAYANLRLQSGAKALASYHFLTPFKLYASKLGGCGVSRIRNRLRENMADLSHFVLKLPMESGQKNFRLYTKSRPQFAGDELLWHIRLRLSPTQPRLGRSSTIRPMNLLLLRTRLAEGSS